MIERDALYRYSGSRANARALDPNCINNDACRYLLERWAKRGFILEAFSIAAVVDVPCILTKIISPDAIPVTFGSACRSSAEAAFIAAVAEAAQSRLTLISGARDDISVQDYLTPGDHKRAAAPQLLRAAFESLPSRCFRTSSEELDALLVMLREASLSPISVALHCGLLDIPIFFVSVPKLRLPS